MRIVGYLLYYAINFFILVLFVRIILSWLALPPSKWLTMLYDFTDPILDFFKKNFPIRIGFLDLSIIIPIIILQILQIVVKDLLIDGQPMTPFYPIILLLIIIKYVFHFAMTILFICCVALLVINFINPHSYHPLVTTIRSIIDPMVLTVRKVIKLKHRYSDRIYLGIVAFLIIVAGFLGNQIIFFIFRYITIFQNNLLY